MIHIVWSATCLAVLVVLFSFSSCAGVEYPRGHVQSFDGELHSISHTADLRAVHFIKKGDRYWVLSEPPPDAAFSYEFDEDMSVSLVSAGGGKDSGSEEAGSASEDLPLTGRAAYVVFTRELLYRVNEMAANTDATFEQYLQAFTSALETIREVAKAESAGLKQSSEIQIHSGANASLSIAEQLSRIVAPGGDAAPAQSGGDGGNESADK